MALSALCDDTDGGERGETLCSIVLARPRGILTEFPLEYHALKSCLLRRSGCFLKDPVAGLDWAGALLNVVGCFLWHWILSVIYGTVLRGMLAVASNGCVLAVRLTSQKKKQVHDIGL